MILDTSLSARPVVITEQITPALCAISNFGLGGRRGRGGGGGGGGSGRGEQNLALCASVRLRASARLSHLDHPPLRTAPAALAFLSPVQRSSEGPETGSARCCFPSSSLTKKKKNEW